LRSADLKATIFCALAIVIERHPALSAIVMDEDSNEPYFARLPKINLEDAVTFLTRQEPVTGNGRDVELDNILEIQHNTPFKEGHGTLPYWRLIIVTPPRAEEEFVASFIFHHSLGDGTSGMVFHRDFFAALCTNPSPLTNTIVLPVNAPLHPNLEALLPFATPPVSASPNPTKLWSGTNIIPPTRSNFHSLILSAKTTTRLLQACKLHGTTLTSTLPVLIASAIFSAIPDTFDSLECTIPVSLRRFLPEPISENVIGVYLDAFSAHYDRTPNAHALWPEAQRSRGLINDYLKTNGEKVNVAKFKQIRDMRAFFLGRVGKERGTSFDVSNLGIMKVEADEKEPWKMGKVVFSRSAFVSGSAIAAGVVTGADGCLTIGFCWQERVVENAMVEIVIETVRARIESIADEIGGEDETRK
jgi:Alcohol acetyltransferase